MSTTVAFWRRPWIAPLLFVTVAFLAFSVPRYLTLDPTRSLLPIRENAPLHYPALVLHIFLGSVALLASCFQVWPWFRSRYPSIHRLLGRAYVSTALPAAVLAIPVSIYGHTGFVGSAGNLLLSTVWFATTVAGFRMARQRRFQEHRRWMIRSFALGMSIVVNRLWGVLMIAVVVPLITSTDAEAEALMMPAFTATVWLSWVVNLLLAEWWIERTSRRRPTAAPRRDDRTSGTPSLQPPEPAQRSS
ncbi:DUF2306 domain-containing protein [Umezawaea endophytica]|uniref:DUF2306 domain-containing protein n=1 Tax=Umezawaea endophytica TaxID=1654476 RepID=A0A9X2VGU6_9PSEU|nr:DUF2306 domain-containing protein [Umezawaea endophytica]MCS7476405.1 DUF2306 domain-containing protein [Umezawaea endophytica]